jgi:hypothetical protein
MKSSFAVLGVRLAVGGCGMHPIQPGISTYRNLLRHLPQKPTNFVSRLDLDTWEHQSQRLKVRLIVSDACHGSK